MSAGKGDSPRNCFSKEFRNRYAEINWGRKAGTKGSKKTKGTKPGKAAKP